MKIYLVGGAVRDMILGLEPKDKDYVIVGATSSDVERLIAQGFQRVGADFPVFLHPETGDEYALARIERKVGVGYNGFEAFTSPDLTIEDDLSRRDVTINAMAIDLETNDLIDPFGGREDLQRGLLCHVSEAFAEDPLRVLRVARFQARYGFRVEAETLMLMKRLVDSGELDHLTRERIWVEMEKLFSEKSSIIGIKTLYDIGAFDRIFIGNNMNEYINDMNKMSDDECSDFENMNVISKFVTFFYFAKWSSQQMQAMKIPSEFQKAFMMYQQIRHDFIHLPFNDANGMMSFIENAELLKTSKTFQNIKQALIHSTNRLFDDSLSDKFLNIVNMSVLACQAVDCYDLSKGMKNGKEIAEKIRTARITAIQNILKATNV